MRIRGERERQEEHERENILERRTRHESSRGRARLDRDTTPLRLTYKFTLLVGGGLSLSFLGFCNVFRFRWYIMALDNDPDFGVGLKLEVDRVVAE